MGDPSSYPDLATICRLCLKQHQEAYGIFAEDDSQLSIPVRLMACIALDAKPGDSLPKKICVECRYQLEKFFLFRQRCQAAEKKLRKHIRLLGLGKRSRVFCKDPDDDDYDEDELEFEDSIAFISKQDKGREEAEEKRRDEAKEQQEKELAKRLLESQEELRLKLSVELRKDLAQEVRSDVREELRAEVTEEARKEQIVRLVGELEVFLTEKKAGIWEVIDSTEESEAKSMPKTSSTAQTSSKPASKALAKLRLITTSKSSLQCIKVKSDEEEILLGGSAESLPADEIELGTIDMDEAAAQTGEDFRDIKMVGAGDVEGTEDDRFYIINSTNNEDTKPNSTPDFEDDNDCTSYNIRENGEIQFSGEKPSALEDVVVFNLDSEMSEEQQVYKFEDNVIILAKDKSSDEPQPAKRKRTNDLVFKQTPREGQPRAGRVSDTVKTFQCQLCPVAFATERMFTRHMNTHVKGLKSGKGGTLKCPICELQLSCSSSLKRHMIIHTGVKPFKCEECDQSFSQREVLKRHMDTHTGAKRHKCPHCSSCFAQKSNLHQHIRRVHLGSDRSHKCHLCPRSFHHMSGLSRHLVTHSGIFFACKECGRQFNDRSAVQRHVQTVHKISNKSEDNTTDAEMSDPEFQAL
ncbi:uncharacterized protein Dana_GF18031 [Drosophila ananassae]|uniref:Uncharacterized protein n=1 Tax=Drosophila ananassae TaxID=7217 RepID=B3LV46_DROAN|nr:zinc finger and BTB domain-containing protein 17 [Drosophila ananassae]EDV42518.1 uncharacterized protein Dana_GF18031 [Drosophila ananassae]